MGGLDKFRRYLPGQLRATCRLDLLGVKAALRAVQNPARASGVEFDDDAAQILVDDLRLVYSGYGDEDTPSMKSPYIEPVLLQVVCYGLFRTLSKKRGSNFDAITVKDVQDFKPFDKAISKYYRTVIQDATKEADIGDAAKGDHDTEHFLRYWVAHDLISHQRLRRQTRQKPRVPNPDAALNSMRDLYLVRDDPRLGGPPLWELSHDMLVGPILEDNRAWRVKNLDEWQVRAEDWHASGHDPVYLLQGSPHLTASPHRRRAKLTKTEQDFIKASADAYYAEGLRARLRAQFGLLSGLLVLSLLTNVILIVLLWGRL
jgi:hypothetical protein